MENSNIKNLIPVELKRRNTLDTLKRSISVLNSLFDEGVRTYQGFRTVVCLMFPKYNENEQVLRSFWHCKSLEKTMLADMESVLADLKKKKQGRKF